MPNKLCAVCAWRGALSWTLSPPSLPRSCCWARFWPMSPCACWGLPAAGCRGQIGARLPTDNFRVSLPWGLSWWCGRSAVRFSCPSSSSMVESLGVFPLRLFASAAAVSWKTSAAPVLWNLCVPSPGCLLPRGDRCVAPGGRSPRSVWDLGFGGGLAQERVTQRSSETCAWLPCGAWLLGGAWPVGGAWLLGGAWQLGGAWLL